MGSAESRVGMSRHSTFLFKVPSWYDGVGPVLDVSGNGYYRYATSANGAEADRRAFAEDANAVAADLASALFLSAAQAR